MWLKMALLLSFQIKSVPGNTRSKVLAAERLTRVRVRIFWKERRFIFDDFCKIVNFPQCAFNFNLQNLHTCIFKDENANTLTINLLRSEIAIIPYLMNTSASILVIIDAYEWYKIFRQRFKKVMLSIFSFIVFQKQW